MLLGDVVHETDCSVIGAYISVNFILLCVLSLLLLLLLLCLPRLFIQLLVVSCRPPQNAAIADVLRIDIACQKLHYCP